MIATRPECGTGYGIRYHLAKDEPLCDLCTDHVMDRRLVRETRTLTGSTTTQERTLRQAIHALAQMLDEHDTTKRTQPAPAPVASITPRRPVATRDDSKHNYRACTRCGIVRQVKTGRSNSDMCRDCRDVERDAS